MPYQSATSALITVTDETFADVVLGNDRPVVVDIWAQWCPSCTKLSRVLTELAEEFGDRMLVTTLNADENPRTTRAYGVLSLPTLLVFRGGEVVGTIVGFTPKIHLRQTLTAHAGL